MPEPSSQDCRARRVSNVRREREQRRAHAFFFGASMTSRSLESELSIWRAGRQHPRTSPSKWNDAPAFSSKELSSAEPSPPWSCPFPCLGHCSPPNRPSSRSLPPPPRRPAPRRNPRRNPPAAGPYPCPCRGTCRAGRIESALRSVLHSSE